jgi:hypothetical protein
MQKKYLFLFLVITLFYCCTTTNVQKDFIVRNFNPITNYNSKDLTLKLDYKGALNNGFVIPSIRQTDDGLFHFEFEIQNISKLPKKFYYKIYYQNESYKFPETDENNQTKENKYANENFYGSWEDVNKTFDSTSLINPDNTFHKITNSYRIVGNPRDEKRYYGGNNSYKSFFSESEILEKMNEMKKNKEWLKNIIEKAKNNNISVDKQMKSDAIYTLKAEMQKGNINNRWKRNPRVGNYSFLIVISTKENLNSIPDYIKNISVKNEGTFANPYFYFLYGKGKNKLDLYCEKSNTILKVFAQPEITAGIYADINDFNCTEDNYKYPDNNCSGDSTMFYNAPFQQFLNYVNPETKFNNIPVVADVTGGMFSRDDYNKSLTKYSKDDLINIPQKVSDCPCKTVSSDKLNKKIVIKNPGNSENTMFKENVGIMTRNGFTYGKFRAKVKMPELLNKDYLWNGLTNAIWLIYQGGFGDWNARRNCDAGEGYIPKHLDGKDAKREHSASYSEIDFEILKCNRYWPKGTYHDKPAPMETPDDKDKIIVTCTNWDLACYDPPHFSKHVGQIQYKDKNFETFRWDEYYKALTIKTAEKEKDLYKSKYYYFEIEWKPNEIIWRIGPEKNNLHIVGYMNDKVTSIPNNQMLMVISQEFHLGWWWPEAPFDQNHIPFPKKDIVGEIYEINIE